MDRTVVSRNQRAIGTPSISSEKLGGVASSHRVDNDGVTFHLRNAIRKHGSLADNVVRRCQIVNVKNIEKQTG